MGDITIFFNINIEDERLKEIMQDIERYILENYEDELCDINIRETLNA